MFCIICSDSPSLKKSHSPNTFFERKVERMGGLSKGDRVNKRFEIITSGACSSEAGLGTLNLSVHDSRLKDHLGSTRAVINEGSTSWLIQEAIAYLAYGAENQLTQLPPDNVTRQKYTGKELDEDGVVVDDDVEVTSGMGLNYFGARYYDPVVGVFLGVDPLMQDWNVYAYTGNNPVNMIDTTGENWFYYQTQGEDQASWYWHEGSDYTLKNDQGNYIDQAGNPITIENPHSEYENLIVFNQTGINEHDAATGDLTLYGKGYDDIIRQSKNEVFSGGFLPDEGTTADAIKSGNYITKPKFRDVAGEGDLLSYNVGGQTYYELDKSYGIQYLPKAEKLGCIDARYEWGEIRMRLIPMGWKVGDPDPGYYIHGKERKGDYSHGCISDRSQQITKYFWNNKQLNKNVPVYVP